MISLALVFLLKSLNLFSVLSLHPVEVGGEGWVGIGIHFPIQLLCCSVLGFCEKQVFKASESV